MCGRYVTIKTVQQIEKRFNVRAIQPELFQPSYNVSHGKLAPIITQEQPHNVILSQFGFTPNWAKKQTYLINARSEGDNNRENDPAYSGGKGILQKPMFRNSIRNKRCLIIADCFYEGDENLGLDKPYVVYLRDKERPFCMAGVYDEWLNPSTGEKVHSFAIITTTANKLLQRIGHHRSPVIIRRGQEMNWLGMQTHIGSITAMLHPYPSELMNAYPVSKKVKSPKNDSPDLIEPIGERVYPEFNLTLKEEMKVEGMGHRKETGRTPMKEESWAEMMEREKKKEEEIKSNKDGQQSLL